VIQVRPATPSDLEALGRYGAALMRQHHAADARRFISVENPEMGYGRFLVSQITKPESLVIVAEDEGRVIGYVYADVEGTSWMDLRGPAGVIHDIYVDDAERHRGAGRALMRVAIDWIWARGRTQIVLLTKTKNEHAQHLFAAVGFRPTMIEMTLDRYETVPGPLKPPGDPGASGRSGAGGAGGEPA
jgi:ribosomal protein S18 acetylase RimI-like enzyme